MTLNSLLKWFWLCKTLYWAWGQFFLNTVRLVTGILKLDLRSCESCVITAILEARVVNFFPNSEEHSFPGLNQTIPKH